ncbi:MAG TPA: MerR family transcriptional regulator, partial [Gemmatimonadaceae bacterium]
MLRIGELARVASVNVQTVRYYERLGMLRPERRTAAGYREYDGEAALRLRFIKHAQQLGFSLKEIDELLGLRVRHGAACATIERKTRHKIALIGVHARRSCAHGR